VAVVGGAVCITGGLNWLPDCVEFWNDGNTYKKCVNFW
jgi:hypothetical protein